MSKKDQPNKKGKKKKHVKAKTKTAWEFYLGFITMVVLLLVVGVFIGRASVRMVDDPKDQPRVLKIKDLGDGSISWQEEDPDKAMEPGDIFSQLQSIPIVDNDRSMTFSMSRKFIVLSVKDRKQY